MLATILTVIGFIADMAKDFGKKGLMYTLAVVLLYVMVCGALFIQRNWQSANSTNIVSTFTSGLKQMIVLTKNYAIQYLLKPTKWLSLWKKQ